MPSLLQPSAESLNRLFFGAALVMNAAGYLMANQPESLSIAWSHATPMPEPRDGYAAGVMEGRLLVIGGTYWEGSKDQWSKKIFSASTHAFDPATQSWEKLADAPVTLGYPASTTLADEIIIIAGLQNGKASQEVYSLGKVDHQFIWRRLPPLPEPRVFASAVTIGKIIYVVGGTLEFEPFDEKGTCCTTKTARNTLWALDTAEVTPRWQERSGYPGELRWLHQAATDGTALYLFGGIYQATPNAPVQKINDVLSYDGKTDRWSRLADMPEAMQMATAIGLQNKVILVSSTTEVMLFNPQHVSFSALNRMIERVSITKLQWIPPYLVGAGGENELEGDRRRSAWTFLGRLSAAPFQPPLVKIKQ